MSADQAHEAAQLRDQGWTWPRLGERYDRSGTAVRNAVIKRTQAAVESS